MSKLASLAVLIALVIGGFVLYSTYGHHVFEYVRNFDEPKIKDDLTYNDGNTLYVCSAPIKLQRVWLNESYVYQPINSGDADKMCKPREF